MIQRLDRADQRGRAVRHRPRRSDPPDALARRQEPRLHPPRPVQIDPLSARHRLGPRDAADRHARPRHAGNLGDPWRLSGDQLDSGQPLDRLLGAAARSTASTSPRGAVSDIPFHVAGTRFVEDALRLQKEVAPDQLRREDGALRQGQPRRPPGRLRGARPSVDQGRGRRRAAAADPRATTSSSSTRPGRATGGRSPTSAGTTRTPAGSRSCRRAAAPAATVTPEPGHYRRAGLLARRPDDRLPQDQRRLSDHAAVGPRPGHLRRAGARRDAAQGRQGRHAAAVRRGQRPAVLHGQREGGQALAALGRARGREGDHAPDRRRTRPSSRSRPTSSSSPGPSATRPMSCRSRCAGRSIDMSPERQGAAAGPGQHRRRRLAALVGQRPQPVLDAGARAVPPRPRAPPPASPRRPRSRRRRRAIPLGFAADAARPSGMLALTGARIITMRGDEVIENGTVLIDGNRIAAVGPTAAVSYPGRDAHHRRQPARPSFPGLIDAHWHGSMGSEEIIPQQNWVLFAGPRLRRDHRPRPVQRHQRDFRRVRAAEGRA